MSGLDGLAMLVYALALLAIGMRSRRPGSGPHEFTLADRSMPTLAVLCSMSATELSAATFIGVPHAAYTGDWSYLQLAFGALLAKVLLAWKVIPLYHALGVETVYGFLGLRLGPAVQRTAAACFVVGRILASAVRLFIAGLALATVADVPIHVAILGAGLVATAYTTMGGIRAVVWTDALQALGLRGAALGVLWLLFVVPEGGFGALVDWAQRGGRMEVFDDGPLFSLSDGSALGVALVGAFGLTLATHATDHDMVQRLLTARSGAAGGRALFGSALLNFPLTMLFLAIGTGLAFHYRTPPDYAIDDAARILPLFALHELPAGARGIFFAGLFAAAMSSLDSALCAIATAWHVDVRADPGGEAARARGLRLDMVVFAAILMAVAMGMAEYHALLSADRQGPSLVDFALSSMTILYGGLAGLFALALLSRRRGSPRSALAGLLAGALLGLMLFLQPLWLEGPQLAWAWWIPLAGTLTFAIGATAARPPRPGDELC